jgi:hypothetical protein
VSEKMMLLKDKDIEYILSVLDNGYRTFGEANVALAKQSPLKQQSAERHLTCFQLRDNSAYSVLVEARDSGIDLNNGPVKFAIGYFDRHVISKSSVSKISNFQNLGQLFLKVRDCRLGLDYVAESLESAGLKWTDGFNCGRVYSGDAMMEGVQVGVRVDLREIPDHPRFPREYSLELHVKVTPQFKYAPAPSPQPVRQVSSPQLTLPLRFVAVKP